MRTDFVTAFMWLYGGTKTKANRTYDNAMSCGDIDYVREIIKCFNDNAKRNFYE